MGDVEEERLDQYLPLDDVRALLEQRWMLTPNDHTSGGPARYVDIAETGGRLGFITPHTGNFCAGCNRLRVTAQGKLRLCLFGEGGVDLRDLLTPGAEEELAVRIAGALGGKAAGHRLREGLAGAARNLAQFGG